MTSYKWQDSRTIGGVISMPLQWGGGESFTHRNGLYYTTIKYIRSSFGNDDQPVVPAFGRGVVWALLTKVVWEREGGRARELNWKWTSLEQDLTSRWKEAGFSDIGQYHVYKCICKLQFSKQVSDGPLTGNVGPELPRIAFCRGPYSRRYGQKRRVYSIIEVLLLFLLHTYTD